MRYEIQNRKKQKVVVVVENPEGSQLSIIMHGLGGTKEGAHVRTFAESFLAHDFTVVTFDTTNTFGESDGTYEGATTTGYYEDLEDVIAWSKKQSWYKAPFFLAGHSLGGICTLLYQVNHPNDVKAIALISTVVSGRLTFESPAGSKWSEWKERGYNEYTSTTGIITRLPWSHYEDRLKYDILKDVDKINVPVLMIVGDKDENTPVEHQKILFDALNTDKEFHIIKNAPHTFKDEKHLKEIRTIFNNWIERVIK
jgi:pimeloyl-ACP methyl ester carboxylesterase